MPNAVARPNNERCDDLQAECLRLATRDSPRARTELYLRLLYGEAWWCEACRLIAREDMLIPSATLELVKNINAAQLALERESRKRNLKYHIQRSCPSLSVVLGSEKLLDLVSRFANSPELWRPLGRSLAENFCFFCYGLAYEPDSVEAAMLRLSGVISGIGALPEAPSPWTDAIKSASDPMVEGAVTTEAFHCAWKLIDDDGRLPNSTNLEAIRAKANRLMVIALFPGHKLLPFVVEV